MWDAVPEFIFYCFVSPVFVAIELLNSVEGYQCDGDVSRGLEVYKANEIGLIDHLNFLHCLILSSFSLSASANARKTKRLTYDCFNDIDIDGCARYHLTSQL